MKKCPYCGYETKEQTPVCFKCRAAIPADEAQDNPENPAGEEPVRISKRKIRSE